MDLKSVRPFWQYLLHKGKALILLEHFPSKYDHYPQCYCISRRNNFHNASGVETCIFFLEDFNATFLSAVNTSSIQREI
jgi:hypothetical protein